MRSLYRWAMVACGLARSWVRVKLGLGSVRQLDYPDTWLDMPMRGPRMTEPGTTAQGSGSDGGGESVPLDPVADQILRDNAWDLYE